jgi:tetratricopeptide (TPR) repeat protein
MSDLLALRPGARKGCRRAIGATAHYAEGCALEAIDAAGAARAYEKAILARPTLADAHNNLARLRHEAGAVGAAEAGYRAAIAAAPAIGLYHYNLGVALEDRGAVDDAIAAYQAALAREPRLAEAHFNLAGLLERRGNLESLHDAVRHLAVYKALRRVG